MTGRWWLHEGNQQAFQLSYCIFGRSSTDGFLLFRHLWTTLQTRYLSVITFQCSLIRHKGTVRAQVTFVYIYWTDWSDQTNYSSTVVIITNYEKVRQRTQYCQIVLQLWPLLYAVSTIFCYIALWWPFILQVVVVFEVRLVSKFNVYYEYCFAIHYTWSMTEERKCHWWSWCKYSDQGFHNLWSHVGLFKKYHKVVYHRQRNTRTIVWQ